MTSNIGNDAHKLKAKSGFLAEEDKNSLQNGLKGYFSEEFINRIDEIIVFNRLTKDNLYEITLSAIVKD
jgi:ATP-dependent Clp protease ATP-binding subunit ClpA